MFGFPLSFGMTTIFEFRNNLERGNEENAPIAEANKSRADMLKILISLFLRFMTYWGQ